MEEVKKDDIIVEVNSVISSGEVLLAWLWCGSLMCRKEVSTRIRHHADIAPFFCGYKGLDFGGVCLSPCLCTSEGIGFVAMPWRPVKICKIGQFR